MLGVASLNFNIWNRLESHGIACSKHALHSPEEKCEQFHRPSSSAGAGLVNMAINVVLTLSRNQPISPALHSVLGGTSQWRHEKITEMADPQRRNSPSELGGST